MWQPIETAPRDGTPILAACPHGIEKIAWEENGGGPACGDPKQEAGWAVHAQEMTLLDEGWMTGSGYYMEPETQPTHWMPLPPPPTES